MLRHLFSSASAQGKTLGARPPAAHGAVQALQRHAALGLALLFLAAFALLIPALYARPRPPLAAEMQIALPRFVQVLMTGGDRYLAANLADFRALVVSTETLPPEGYRVLAQVQQDAAWLNPAHEDNYYIASAILPWYGQLAAAQTILRQASDARPFDPQPPFYYAFNTLHFLKDPIEAARWLRVAAAHSDDELEKIQFQQLASAWLSKGDDLALAIALQKAMIKEARHAGFARFLQKRLQRLENLFALEQAMARYRQATGKAPTQLNDLLRHGELKSLPLDPFGALYWIDAKGRPALLPRPVAQRLNGGAR
ncbi:MAG: hypothetical protein V4623_01210 [Pseudomonadota bacterium]